MVLHWTSSGAATTSHLEGELDAYCCTTTAPTTATAPATATATATSLTASPQVGTMINPYKTYLLSLTGMDVYHKGLYLSSSQPIDDLKNYLGDNGFLLIESGQVHIDEDSSWTGINYRIAMRGSIETDCCTRFIYMKDILAMQFNKIQSVHSNFSMG
jgi:hypothetical protein